MKKKIEEMIRDVEYRQGYAERMLAGSRLLRDEHMQGYWTAVMGENGALASSLRRILNTEA